MNWLGMFAALSGALAVLAGAFGAHGAKGEAAEILRTGAQYQMIHAVAALVALQLGARGPAWLFVAGRRVRGLALCAGGRRAAVAWARSRRSAVP